MDSKNITNLTLGFNFSLNNKLCVYNPTSSTSKNTFQILTVKSLATGTPIRI